MATIETWAMNKETQLFECTSFVCVMNPITRQVKQGKRGAAIRQFLFKSKEKEIFFFNYDTEGSDEDKTKTMKCRILKTKEPWQKQVADLSEDPEEYVTKEFEINGPNNMALSYLEYLSKTNFVDQKQMPNPELVT